MRYTTEQRAQVAGLRASGLTQKEIAARTGIPRTSVAYILDQTPIAEVVETATREQVSASLWQVVSAGTTEALRRISDPATKAGELAQLIKVAADQYALLTGGVTDRTESLNVHAEVEPVPLLPEGRRALIWEALRRIEEAPDDEIDERTVEQLRVLTNGTRLILTGKASPDPIEGVHYVRGGPRTEARLHAAAGRAEADALAWRAEQEAAGWTIDPTMPNEDES